MLRVTNTLTRAKEPVTPHEPGRVRMYTCGPTVYRYMHVGNLRSFLLADLVRRALEVEGLEVDQVQNVTDVGHMTDEEFDRGEDKMLVSAQLEDRSSEEIADYYTEAFRRDIAAMNLRPARAYPRATEYVPRMIELVRRLLELGHGYEVDGDVYFAVESFPHYGRLSGNSLDQLRAGHRMEEVDPRKRHHADFALWRSAGPGRLVKWDSPWGEGFPGWHIECSAMSLGELGEHIDLHTGGVDNVFPHHEDEIAQSEAVVGHQVVGTWVHGEHLLTEGRKMAKSAGNFYGLRDLEERGHSPLALRLLFLQAHYSSQMNFTWDALAAAERSLERRRARVAAWAADPGPAGAPEATAGYERRFWAAVDDDLDTPKALAVLAEMEGDEGLPAAARHRAALAFDRVLGLDLGHAAGQELPPGAEELIARREAARAARDWATADRLRDDLAALGVEVSDTRGGTSWRLLPRPR
ncbi:MAG TPA: cysteine--tRNA ligase [Actinomycetes bacterium]